MSISVCLLCRYPDEIWLDFLCKFEKYDIFVVIDDNNIFYQEKYKNYKKYTKINFIQIQNTKCKENGFTNMNHTINKDISAWEKAMYYFSSINTSYKNIWFLEDDVFLYDENTLINIDKKYTASDLISNSYTENINGHKNDWHWKQINIINIPPPYYCAMVCAVRISDKMLTKIKDYAREHKTLFFLEALFPTLCKYNHFIYDTPPEFINIVFETKYNINDFDKYNLYHPVKQLDEHILYRNKLSLDIL